MKLDEIIIGIEKGSLHLNSSSTCPDFCRTKRTISERLFSLPWRPFHEYKDDGELLLLYEDQAICSPRTYKKIMEKIDERRLQNGQR